MLRPTILDRYIFLELVPPFFMSLGALCFVMLTRELLRLVELLVSKGVGLFAVLKVFAHLLPSFLVLTLPMAGLIASITAFGRLSYEKELVAMRAAGWSLLRLSRSVFLFGALVCGLTFTLSRWGQPWTTVNLKKVALHLLRDQLVLALDRGVFNEPIPGMTIFIPEQEADGSRGGIFVADSRNPDEPRIIVAREYAVVTDRHTNQVALRLQDGVVHTSPDSLNEYRQVSFSTYDLKLSLAHVYPPADDRPSLELTLEQLKQSNWTDSGALRRLTEYYKDLAFPAASLVFCILGIPVGIVSKRSGRIGGFAVGVMVIITYYLLNVVCEFLVTSLVLPPFAGAWLPNGIFLAVTVAAFYHMNRR